MNNVPNQTYPTLPAHPEGSPYLSLNECAIDCASSNEYDPHMLPQRKKLPHNIPSWVPAGSRYFVTINCQERQTDALNHPEVADALLASIPVYESLEKWYMYVMVIMPDHLHLIASFNRMKGISAVIKPWKGYHASHCGIEWQPDYFEHRIRNDDEFREKVQYVLLNPVRKGLVSDWRDWPYKFVRGIW